VRSVVVYCPNIDPQTPDTMTSPRTEPLATGPDGPVRVAYVGGWGRSGSTLLDRLLGQVEGFVSVGELRQLWKRGPTANATCGCGRAFRECEFWERVGKEAFGGWDSADAEELLRLRQTVDRGWTMPLLVTKRTLPGLESDRARYGRALEVLYGAIATVSGATVIVDSSKLPSYAMILRRVPGIDVRLVHLVRDSRGVAYSWQKHVLKDPGTGEQMHRYHPWSAALRYDLYNEATSLVGRTGTPSLRVRYEDLTADPEPILRRVIEHVAPEIRPDLAFLHTARVDLGVHHAIGGNPMRFRRGATTITTDDGWRAGMPRADRWWVTALTAPLLARYGYPLRVGRDA
jgi:sulfotransferase family protein